MGDQVNSQQHKTYSCVRCFERKVKCDKQYPCHGCVRSNVECVFRIRAPPRRRQRLATDEAVLSRLKHYENLLLQNGIDPTSPSDVSNKGATDSQARHVLPSTSSTPGHSPSSARLIVDQGRSRFIENKLWAAVSEEVHSSKDVIAAGESEEDMDSLSDDSIDFVLGMTPSSARSTLVHPAPDHIWKLWHIFLANVNPLIKLVHQPTLERSIERAIADIENIPHGLEALMFAIYGASILSMRDGECRATFGESRSILLSRYRLGARRSLTKAQFMRTSDLIVVQAFVIYLLTMRQVADNRTLWTASGIATRIARVMGLHRDGTALGLSPFETEMRRRLHFQISHLDSSAAELCGLGSWSDLSWWNAKLPSNVNDVDIWPDMKDPPEQQDGATEMMVCLLRSEIGHFFGERISGIQTTAEQDFTRTVQHWVETATIPEKDEVIDGFEKMLEEKYLKYCDQSKPIHQLAIFIGRFLCYGMKIATHHPRRYPKGKIVPASERLFLWTTTMAVIQLDNQVHSQNTLQKFNWYIDVEFNWSSLIYVLGELLVQPVGNGKDDAWSQIEGIFRNHPDFISDHKKPLHIAIANMCLKAWRIREKAQLQDPQGCSWLDTPSFIVQLRKQREDEEAKVRMRQIKASQLDSMSQAEVPQLTTNSESTVASTQQFQSESTFDMPFSPDFSIPMLDDMAIDWQTWDTLMNDVDNPLLLAGGMQAQFQNMDGLQGYQ